MKKTVKRRAPTTERALRDLDAIGPAMLRDFAKLGIETVAQLSKADPDALYERISALDGVRHDPCVLDTFRCAVAQARDPELPAAQRRWWWWSRLRKRQGAVVARGD